MSDIFPCRGEAIGDASFDAALETIRQRGQPVFRLAELIEIAAALSANDGRDLLAAAVRYVAARPDINPTSGGWCFD